MLELLGLGSLAKEKKVVQIGTATETNIALPISAKKIPSAEALLVAEREKARAARDFERADAIRSELEEMGWEVRDSSDGAKLVPKS
jgi:cysteinyl-tRNA synthetase